MNLKQILSLAVIAGLSSHAYALEIYHGRVLSEKTWSTDGGKVTFAKKSQFARAKEGLPQSQRLEVGIANVSGTAGQPLTLSGNHYIYIENNTANNQTYFYNISVCAYTSNKTSHCVYQTKNLELSEGGYFLADSEPELTLSFDAAGNYPITASTWIRGTGNNSQGFMSAVSTATIS